MPFVLIMRIVPIVGLLFLCGNRSLYAQTSLPVPKTFQKSYQSGARSISGSPGKNYWQNNADYRISVFFDPAASTLSGELDAEYHNNSPDTLKQLVFKLYPNLYQKQAMRNMPIRPEDLTDGVEIRKLFIGDKIYSQKEVVERGTNLYVRSIHIVPGETAHIHVEYSYPVNKSSFIRTGRVDSGSYMIAYFFPRIAVYDDIDGWNEYPYMGKEEFYNDYGNFDVAITLPGNYSVWATGELENPSEVYAPTIRQRLASAQGSDGITDIITENDLKTGRDMSGKASLTWRFKAIDVTDFAFSVSNHDVWKATSVLVDTPSNRRVMVNTVFNPLHASFLPIASYAHRVIELISYKIPGIPFPYPHATIFEGLDAMEYPMMVNNQPFKGVDGIEFTAHELSHSLFPFYVGTNETKYSFMDEGWATYTEFTMLKQIDPSAVDAYDLGSVNESAGTEQDMPVITLTPQLYGKARYADKDLKPALALRYLCEMLGDTLFYSTIRYYINQWKGKHPSPYDFFACMNKGAGVNLDWFWQNWYFEKNTPDLAINWVKHVAGGYDVNIVRKGKGMLPIHLLVYYTDGTTYNVTKTVACWRYGNSSLNVRIPGKKSIKTVQLGTSYDADSDTSNNRWPRHL